MSSTNYTLDRFEAGYAIFLRRPQETEQLIIARTQIDVELQAGDIVEITPFAHGYHFRKLQHETKAAEDRIKQIMSRLNKK